MSETLPAIAEESRHLEFKDENVVVSAELLPACKAKFKVTVTPEASRAAYEKAVRAVCKDVTLPGFRKGKAPSDSVKKLYSDSIEREWQRKLLQVSVSEATRLSGKNLYYDDSLSEPRVIKASLDEDSVVSFQIEHAPEIPSFDLSQIVVHRVTARPVDEKAVEQEIERLRQQNASWELVEGRAAKEGDYVDLRILSVEENPQSLCETARFLLEDGKMAPWMYRVVKGLNVNDSVEATIEDTNIAPEDLPPPEELQCKITLQAIYKAILPEVNEDFARKLGADSVEKLKSNVESGLKSKNEKQAWKDMEGQVVEQLLVKYPFEIPEREREAEMNLQYARLQSRFENKDYPAADKVRMLREVQRYVDTLPNTYRLLYLARDLAKHYHIKITEQELTSEITQHLLLSRVSYDTLVDESMDPRVVQKMVFNHLQLHKVIQFILENAKVVD